LDRGWGAGLPSEAEWEKAARGGLLVPIAPAIQTVQSGLMEFTKELPLRENESPQRRFPWPGEFQEARANIGETGIGSTSAVGCFSGGASPYGLLDLSGNVWEWTRSLFGDYPYPVKDKARRKREDFGASEDSPRVLRGGSFLSSRRYARCACRGGRNPDLRYNYVGFRVVVSPADSGL
jgi:iron(II)-dependent oxidoreductase